MTEEEIAATTTTPKFGKEPIVVKCPECRSVTVSLVELQTTYISYLLTIIIILLFGFFFAIFLIPFALIITRTHVHRCGACYRELGSDNNIFSLFDLQDKVLSLHIGEIGIVLTRKILFAIFLLAIISIALYLNLNRDGWSFRHLHYTNITWEDFLKQCGQENMMRDPYNVAMYCEQRYLDRTVINWKGYVIRVDDYRESMWKYMHHAATILVRMVPHESEYLPDILLTFDTEKVDAYGHILNDLSRGQAIGFNATIKSFAIGQQTRHFHVEHAWVEEGFMEIPPHVHDQGRYADRPRFFRGNQLEGNGGEQKKANVIIEEVKKEEKPAAAGTQTEGNPSSGGS